jgi:hypothetical protein
MKPPKPDPKLKIIYFALLLSQTTNTAEKTQISAVLSNLINDYGKTYHLQIKTLKTPKKPLISVLLKFIAGSDISINENVPDMQALLNELNNTLE